MRRRDRNAQDEDNDRFERGESGWLGGSGGSERRCCGGGWRRGELWRGSYSHASGAEYYELESYVGSRWDGGDDQWCELWGDARNEHGDVQRDNGEADELERHERCCLSASRGNDRQCGGDGRGRWEQRGYRYGSGRDAAARGGAHGGEEQC